MKLVNELLKSYLKKSPFFAHAVNSIHYQAGVTMNKALVASKLGTT